MMLLAVILNDKNAQEQKIIINIFNNKFLV